MSPLDKSALGESCKAGKFSRTAAIWTPDAFAQLGVTPERLLASQLGIDSASVRQKRRSLGSNRWIWTEAQVSLLGTASDREAAMQVGCTIAQVWHARN